MCPLLRMFQPPQLPLHSRRGGPKGLDLQVSFSCYVPASILACVLSYSTNSTKYAYPTATLLLWRRMLHTWCTIVPLILKAPLTRLGESQLISLAICLLWLPQHLWLAIPHPWCCVVFFALCGYRIHKSTKHISTMHNHTMCNHAHV